ncbi:aspartate carbamoyltransferase catalytic subunit [Peptococcus simiae]|uniref:Aspartate carbamoyltransferase n=1 Tax=Peptococcus simiae TaxID=1643805 RepID=A0ABW9GYW6_9FIRM
MLMIGQHLLSIAQLTPEDIDHIFTVARDMRDRLQSSRKKRDDLDGRAVINLFYENSTRTRTSFELAAKYLGAEVVNIVASASSVQKGESLKDTAATLNRLKPDGIIMRHPASGAHKILCENVDAIVINGGDGTHAHPTQALLDGLTISDHKGDFSKLTIAIIGDILHSRVARSNIALYRKYGATIRVAGPRTLIPPAISDEGVIVCPDMETACRDADVIMMLRIQLERQDAGLFPSVEEYAHFYELNPRRLALAKPDVIVLHPGPINRGVEIEPSVADGDRSLINEQVTNGLAIRMALLKIMTEEA